MTKKEFHQLHRECSESLSEYMAAANKMCIMLGDCAEKKLTLKERSTLATQRTLENHLFGQYHKVRDKLLEAARVGYGSMESTD